jgi:formylglycine-generating enzyme required for sulfatase activity
VEVGFRIALIPIKEQFDLKSLKKAVKQLPPRFSSVNNRFFKVDDLDFEMIFVEGGTFTMGCTSKNCYENEEPAHSVTLSDFYMGKFQVTQQLWRKVMGTTLQQQRDLGNPEWELCGEDDEYPIYYINYKESVTFCEKLNRLLVKQLPKGYKFSLPTEAQWEYAARGGRKSKKYIYSGSDDIWKVGNFHDNSNLQIHEIGTKKKNELGIYDMSGNVWEWCSDWFDVDYYKKSPASNPEGPAKGYSRILRGGSWRSSASGCRVSFRYSAFPNERTQSYGMRLALVRE